MYGHKQPVWGWEAELAWVRDDSSNWYRERGEVQAVAGEIKLLPSWDKRTIRWSGDTKVYDLDVYFRTLRNSLIDFLMSLDPGTNLYVSGDLSKRHIHTASSFPELETELDLTDVAIDTSGGKIAAEAAYLYVPDIGEFTEAADERFASRCIRCNARTKEVALESGIRFCPKCDGCMT